MYQGDYLSHFLFTFVSDVSSRLEDWASGMILCGEVLDKEGVDIFHLQFVV